MKGQDITNTGRDGETDADAGNAATAAADDDGNAMTKMVKLYDDDYVVVDFDDDDDDDDGDDDDAKVCHEYCRNAGTSKQSNNMDVRTLTVSVVVPHSGSTTDGKSAHSIIGALSTNSTRFRMIPS